MHKNSFGIFGIPKSEISWINESILKPFLNPEVYFMARKAKVAKAEPIKEEAEEKKTAEPEDEGNIFEDSGDEEEF